MLKQAKCVRKASRRGIITIPRQYHSALDIEAGGGYLRIVQTGPKEIRLTPDSRESWWADRTVGRKKKPEEKSRTKAQRGAEGFVAECLGYQAGGRVTVKKVQSLYDAWIALQGGEMPQVDRAYLGRAIKRMLPDVTRSRAVDSVTGESCPVYRNIGLVKLEGRGEEAPEDAEREEEQDAEDEE